MREQVLATLHYTNFQRGQLSFLEGHYMDDDGKNRSMSRCIRIEDVSVLGSGAGEKTVVEFTRTSSWDDGKDTGPMILTKQEIEEWRTIHPKPEENV